MNEDDHNKVRHVICKWVAQLTRLKQRGRGSGQQKKQAEEAESTARKKQLLVTLANLYPSPLVVSMTESTTPVSEGLSPIEESRLVCRAPGCVSSPSARGVVRLHTTPPSKH